MRRILLLTLLAAGSIAAVVWAVGASNGPSDRYRLSVVFDNASFLTPGQDARIGGAKVGRVSAVHVTPDYKARVELEIDPRFAPFHADADCTIQPQSLIGERFVECTPGSGRSPTLRAGGGHIPTLPVTRTHSSVDLDLVLSTFQASTTQRLRLALNELGAGVAGRAEDLAAIIRRANPALANFRAVLDTVAAQRRRLAPLAANAARAVRSLSEHEALARFVQQSAGVAAVTARRQTDLRAAVTRLPGFLAQLRSTFVATDELLQTGTPILTDARRAAPDLSRLIGNLKPLSRAGAPAFTALDRAAVTGTGTVRAARPVVRRLAAFATRALPVGRQLATLFTNMRTRGVVEGLQAFVFHGTAVIARFDAEAHIATAEAVVPPGCVAYASVPVAGCSVHYGDQANATRATTPNTRAGERRAGTRRPPAAAATGGGAGVLAAKPTAAAPAPAPSPAAPEIHQPEISLTGIVGKLLGPKAPVPPRRSSPPGSAVDDLLDYLLG